MKTTIRHSLIALALAAMMPLSALAQDARQRTTATVIADVLNSMPAETEARYNAAMHDLAACYANGEGTVADPAEAFRWMKLSADNGNVDAMRVAGGCYYNGFGIKENPKKAFALFKKAAECGDVDSMRLVADCYAIGSGTKADRIEAEKWYRRAAENGDMDSREMLDEI